MPFLVFSEQNRQGGRGGEGEGEGGVEVVLRGWYEGDVECCGMEGVTAGSG